MNTAFDGSHGLPEDIRDLVVLVSIEHKYKGSTYSLGQLPNILLYLFTKNDGFTVHGCRYLVIGISIFRRIIKYQALSIFPPTGVDEDVLHDGVLAPGRRAERLQ